MAAELEIKFVGDDAQQKEAFKNPDSAVSQSQSSTTGQLVKKLSDLIDVERNAPKVDAQSAPIWLERLLTGTRGGRAVAGFGRRVATSLGLGGVAAGGGAASGGAASGGAVAAALGPVGVAAAATAVAFTAAAFTVKRLSDAVHGLADGLEDLSPAIASVRAQAEARQTLATLDRANRIGPEVASLEAARFRVAEASFEIQTKILELLLKGSPLLELILDGVTTGIRSVDVLFAAIEQLHALITPDPADDQKAADRLEKAIEALAKSLRDESPPARDPWLEQILQMPGPGTVDAPRHGAFP